MSLRLTQTLLISAIFSRMASASSGFSSSSLSASPCSDSNYKHNIIYGDEIIVYCLVHRCMNEINKQSIIYDELLNLNS